MTEAAQSARLTRRRVLRTAVAGGAAGAAVSSRASAQGTMTVDMTDSLDFEPEEVEVAPGATVVWENVGSVPHSVTAYDDEIPEGASYFASGGFENESAARSAYPDGAIEGGGTYEYTFETEGEYGYFCIPHEGAGMVGTVTVASGAGDGGGGNVTQVGPPEVSDAALSLTIGIMAAMGAILGLAFFVMKYGGAGDDAE